MDKVEFSKAIVGGYFRLPYYIKEIDYYVMKSALRSTNMNYSVYMGAEEYVQRVIDWMNRKLFLIALYEQIGEALDKLNEKNSVFLRLKSDEDMQVEEIAKEFNVSDRTAYRYVENAYKSFYTKMFKSDEEAKKFFELVSSDYLERIFFATRKYKKRK